MPFSLSQVVCDFDSGPIASLSGTDAPLLGDGPRLWALPLVGGVDWALTSVIFVWKFLNASVGGAAIATMPSVPSLSRYQ